MQVYDIQATFMRKRQPKDYENCMAELTAKAHVDDGEDHVQVIEKLFDDLSAAVYSRLGLQNVAKSAQPETAGEAPAEAPAGGSDTKSGGKGSKGGGKSSSSSKSGGKGSKGGSGGQGSSDLPDDGAAQQTNGEDKSNTGDLPEENAAPAETKQGEDLPEDNAAPAETKADEGGAGELSHSDVQSYIAKSVQEKAITIQQAKEVLKKFGAERTPDVPAEKLADLKAELDSLMV